METSKLSLHNSRLPQIAAGAILVFAAFACSGDSSNPGDAGGPDATGPVADAGDADAVAVPTCPPGQSAPTSGVKYTFTANGLTTLTYNGLSFLSEPAGSGNTIVGAIFRTPQNGSNGYGLSHSDGWNNAIASATSTTGNSPDFAQQIYNQGKQDSYTIKWIYSSPDSNTFTTDLYVTNNDPTDTLQDISTEFNYLLTMPGKTPYNPYWYGDGANIGIGQVSIGPNVLSQGPTTFLSGSWGSVVLFSGDYSASWMYGSATVSGGTDQPSFYMRFQNYGDNGGSPANTLEDPILPGETHHYTHTLRFGTPTATAACLAPDAYAAWRKAFPYLVKWPNRAPIGTMFLAGAQNCSAANLRCWSNNLDLSNQAAFTASVLTWTNNIISSMDTLSPKPQGLMIWDLEGEEFYQPLTYVGSPDKLPMMAPEMDAASDAMIAAYQKAGYEVGLTLRASNFGIGPTLPPTCTHDSVNGTGVDSDVYVVVTNTSTASGIGSAGPGLQAGYVCSAPNTWTQLGDRQPAQQAFSELDKDIVATLEAKVQYARGRWGIKLFYIDSVVYGDLASATTLSFLDLRKLETDFPDTLFIPENVTWPMYGAVAPYTSASGNANVTGLDVPTMARDIYPQAFAAIINADKPTSAADMNTLIQSVKNGDILFYPDIWFDNPGIHSVEQLYQSAGFKTQ